MVLEAWERTRAVLARWPPSLQSLSSDVAELEALSRRSRQVERIVDASMVSDLGDWRGGGG